MMRQEFLMILVLILGLAVGFDGIVLWCFLHMRRFYRKRLAEEVARADDLFVRLMEWENQ